MLHYSEDVINEVFAENDIVDFVSQYVLLKCSGKDYSGLCPFHGEKTPSFHVNRDKQLFHCFGCGASGNLVQFAMRIEGLDFVEALKLLADRAGIILPEENGVADDIMHRKRQRIYEMNKVSARFFYDNLVKNDKGRTALNYFNDRGISLKTVTTYGLGYALDEKDSLLKFLKGKGFTDEEILEAGLSVKRDNGVVDKFRNRVIFPIIDLRGNVIGFGGRIMGDSKEINGFKIPKYLNSPETLVFNKGKNLFSLNYAKKDETDKIILVEGYMDVISVYQAGIKNIAATLGTALTPEQAKLLLRYCSEILLCYDSDEAGEKATVRAIEIINGVGGKAKIIRLKDAKDPDEYIKKNGVAAFRKALHEAVPSTEYRISKAKTQYNIDNPEGKIEFISKVAETLQSIQNDVEVDAYIRKTAKETEISTEAIYSIYKKQKGNKTVNKSESKGQGKTLVIGESSQTPASIKPAKGEAMLLNLMIKDKKYIDKVKADITEEYMTSPVSKKLLQLIFKMRENNRMPEAAVLITELDEKEAQLAAGIFFKSEVYNDEYKTLEDLIRDLKRNKINKEIKNTKDPVRLKKLIEELTSLGRN